MYYWNNPGFAISYQKQSKAKQGFHSQEHVIVKAF
jgi:hypothetical protein